MKNMNIYESKTKHFIALSKMVAFCFILLSTTSYLPVYANIEENSQQTVKQSEKKDEKDNSVGKTWPTSSMVAGTLTAGGIGIWLYNKLVPAKHQDPYTSLKKFKSALQKNRNHKHSNPLLLAPTAAAGSNLAVIPAFRPNPTILKTAIEAKREIKTYGTRVDQILRQLNELADKAVQVLTDGYVGEIPEQRLEAADRLHVVLGYDMQRVVLLMELIDIINQNNLSDEALLSYVCTIADELESIFSYGFSLCPEAIIGVLSNNCREELDSLKHEEEDREWLDFRRKQKLILEKTTLVTSFLAEFIKSAKTTQLPIPRVTSNNIVLFIRESLDDSLYGYGPETEEDLFLGLEQLVSAYKYTLTGSESKVDYPPFLSRVKTWELLRKSSQRQLGVPSTIIADEYVNASEGSFTYEYYDSWCYVDNFVGTRVYKEIKKLYLEIMTKYLKTNPTRYDTERLKKVVLDRNLLRTLGVFIRKYPQLVLGDDDFRKRLRSELVRDFAQLIQEATVRSSKHLDDLKRYIFKLDDLSTIVHIKAISVANSDPHRGGKRVVFIEFNAQKTSSPYGSSYEVVYKPASLAVDAMLAGDIKEVSTNGLHSELAATADSACWPSDVASRAVFFPSLFCNYVTSTDSENGYKSPLYSILTYDDGQDRYGFMEALSQKLEDSELTTEKEKVNFSYNVGRVLAEAVLFGINDRHEENFLISKKMLVFIDLETSFSTNVRQLLEKTNMGSIPQGLLFSKVQQGFADFLTAFAKEEGPDIKTLILKMSDQQKANLIARFVPFFTTTLLGICNDFFESKGEMPGSIIGDRIRSFTSNLFSSFTDAVITEKSEKLSELDILRVKFLALIVLNMQSIIDDIARGDIPYFSTNIITGELFDSRGKLLDWKEVTPDQIGRLFNIQSNRQASEKIHDMLSKVKPPLDQVDDGIKLLRAQYKTSGDITECDIYKKNLGKMEYLSRR